MQCEQTVVKRNRILTCTVLLGGGTNTRLHFYRQARTCISPALSVFLRGRHHPLPRLPSCHLDKGQDKKTTTVTFLVRTTFGWQAIPKQHDSSLHTFWWGGTSQQSVTDANFGLPLHVEGHICDLHVWSDVIQIHLTVRKIPQLGGHSI